MAVWTDELRSLDEDVALKVMARIRTTEENPPSPARVREIVHAVSEYDFGVHGARMLPPTSDGVYFAEFLESHPEMSALREKLRHFDRLPAMQAEEIAETKAAMRSLRDLKHTGACSGSGKLVVEHEGARVCPGCGAPVPDMEIRLPKKSGAS